MTTPIDRESYYPPPCNCIGPQRGAPYCPCEMRARGVFERDGRWVEPERDLGPVQNLRDLWENMR